MVVEDDGKGFDLKLVQSGLGMSSIKSRIQMVHGEMRFEPNEKGTAVYVLIPLNA
jgi:signal transduction histidine kinase